MMIHGWFITICEQPQIFPVVLFGGIYARAAGILKGSEVRCSKPDVEEDFGIFDLVRVKMRGQANMLIISNQNCIVNVRKAAWLS